LTCSDVIRALKRWCKKFLPCVEEDRLLTKPKRYDR
jgi:hypothetical protein